MEKSDKSSKSDTTKKKSYLKYSGLVYTMAAAIILGVVLGKYLDSYFQNDTPIWTALLSVVFLLGGMYSGLKDLF